MPLPTVRAPREILDVRGGLQVNWSPVIFTVLN